MSAIVQLFSTLGAPGYGIALALLGAFIWLGRQVLILRRDVGKLRDDVGRSSRDAITDTWDRIIAMRSKGLNEQELALVERQLLGTIQHHTPKADITSSRELIVATPAVPSTPSGQTGLESRFGTVISSVFSFGFLGFWALGWGYGMGSFAIGVVSGLWAWTRAAISVGNIFLIVKGVVCLLVAVLAFTGLWAVPTLGATVGALFSLISIANALLRNKFTAGVSEKFDSLRKRFGVFAP